MHANRLPGANVTHGNLGFNHVCAGCRLDNTSRLSGTLVPLAKSDYPKSGPMRAIEIVLNGLKKNHRQQHPLRRGGTKPRAPP